MPPSMKAIRAMEATRYPVPTRLIYDQPPPMPTSLLANGQQGLIRAQWATVPGVDGYDVAVMTTANLAAPDIDIARIMGPKTREYVYQTGNVALTRFFAVRSFVGDSYSNWSPIVSGLSVVFGTPESAPVVPPSNPPSGDEGVPTGKNFGGNYKTY